VPAGGDASSGPIVRPVVEADLDRIVEIEAASFESPWTRAQLLHEIRHHPFAWNLAVAEGREVVGYIFTWLIHRRIEINEFAIDPGRRRRGLGRLLLERVIAGARGHGVERIVLDVAESNRAARRLYDDLGFHEIARRRGYYPRGGGHEDGIVLELRL